MDIISGDTTKYIYFVAKDSTDLQTRKTGLSAFTVYRARNGGAATAYTTPTIAEVSAANMPGLYTLLADEDTTLTAGNDFEEYAVHITCATMAPVTRTVNLVRPKITTGYTLDVTATGAAGIDWANVENPTTAVNLSGTNIKTDQVIASVSGGVANVGGQTLANLDAAVSTRSTYAGGAVASVTGGVTVTTNNDKTGYTVSTVSDKTGYSLSQAFPANFSAMGISAGGVVNVDVKYMNSAAMLGDGTAGNLWRGA